MWTRVHLVTDFANGPGAAVWARVERRPLSGPQRLHLYDESKISVLRQTSVLAQFLGFFDVYLSKYRTENGCQVLSTKLDETIEFRFSPYALKSYMLSEEKIFSQSRCPSCQIYKKG